MKYPSHLHRMNPQSSHRPRNIPRISTILTALFVSALAALYMIGRMHH
jgi:hypothetical protein